MYARKFFYVFTCEYCFSHYVAAAAVALTGFRLLVTGWTGALIAWLTLVWVANVYMSLFVRLRLDIKRERVEISAEERDAAVRRPAASAAAQLSRAGPACSDAPIVLVEVRHQLTEEVHDAGAGDANQRALDVVPELEHLRPRGPGLNGEGTDPAVI